MLELSRPKIEAEVAPVEIHGTEATRAWVRATEILLRARARREARFAIEAGISVERGNDLGLSDDAAKHPMR